MKEHLIQNIIDQNQYMRSIESVPQSLHEYKQKISHNVYNVLTIKSKSSEN